MAVEIQMTVAWGMLFIMLAVLAIALIVIGQLTGNRPLGSYGFILGGVTAFAGPMAYYLGEAGDEWAAFAPSATDIVVLGSLSFLGGMAIIIGLMGRKSA